MIRTRYFISENCTRIKAISVVLALIFICSSGTNSKISSQDLEIEIFGENPGNLKMFVHDNFSTDTLKKPLVVVLHGCGQSAKDIADLTGWNKLAEINHFIVLYPQQKFTNNPDLCFNWFNGNDINKGEGECESIFEMIQFAKQHFKIDTSKIFITGLSGGGAMGVVLMATHPELFKAGAIFAGVAYKIATNPIDGSKALTGKKYIPIDSLVNAVKKQNPNYTGSYPSLIIYQGLNDPIVNCKSTKLLINQWTGINLCDTLPDEAQDNWQGIKDIHRTAYWNASGKTCVTVYTIDHLGHAILVKPGKKENEGGHTGFFGVNKGYHSTYETAKEFGIILNQYSPR